MRDTDPSKVHLVTTRTRLSEILLRPSRWLNRTVGGVVARYANTWDISIYGIIFLGNHYHILCQGPSGHLSHFAKDMNSEIAQRINRKLRRKGNFWGRRFDSQVTIEEADDIEALLYLTTNAVKHGLVTHPRLWPGLNSYAQLLGGADESFPFLHYTAYHAAKRRARHGKAIERTDYETHHELRIQSFPHLRHLSSAERIAKLNFLVEERVTFLVEERYASGKGFLGRKAILEQQEQGVFPRESSVSNRPRCYTKNAERRRQFRLEERIKREVYAQCSRRFRSGEYNTPFPEYCFRPPAHCIPPPPLISG